MLTAAACGTLSRTAVLNKSVATLRLARSLTTRGKLPAPEPGTCRLAGVEPCRGPRREKTELAGYKLDQTAPALAACASEARDRQRRNAAHYHYIVHPEIAKKSVANKTAKNRKNRKNDRNSGRPQKIVFIRALGAND
jgi:hypothetical protein